MKKNLLFSLFLLSSCAYSADETSEVVDPYNYVVSQHGERLAYGWLVTNHQFIACFVHADVATFKTFQKWFEKQGIRIFSIVINGAPLLAQAIVSVANPQKPGRTELFDYILSQVTAQELNGCVNTFCTEDIYFGTPVAFAALTSPYCLEAILKHPLFDPTDFLTERPVEVTFTNFYIPAKHAYSTVTTRHQSLTPQTCIELLRKRNTSSFFDGSEKLIEILTKRFFTK